MELKLADNVTRAVRRTRTPRPRWRASWQVLAALEQIIDVAKQQFAEADAALKGADAKGAADGLVSLAYGGRTVSLERASRDSRQPRRGISELEKTWFDWRQQFFLGYAQAPSVRNLTLVSATMQRRCQVFRTMGLPSARSSLAMWQQAALAREGAEMSNAVQRGTNELIKGAFEKTADAVEQAASPRRRRSSPRRPSSR